MDGAAQEGLSRGRGLAAAQRSGDRVLAEQWGSDSSEEPIEESMDAPGAEGGAGAVSGAGIRPVAREAGGSLGPHGAGRQQLCPGQLLTSAQGPATEVDAAAGSRLWKKDCLPAKHPRSGLYRGGNVGAFLGDPGRFPNKRKLWKYCGLGLRYRRSAGKSKGRLRRSREYNRLLKGVLGIAAQATRRSRDNALVHYGELLRTQGKSPSIVRRTLSRKIAVIAWSLLKQQKLYQDPKGGEALNP